jgi:lipoprotein-anchoring transpeptidase ErfK/SrfK
VRVPTLILLLAALVALPAARLTGLIGGSNPVTPAVAAPAPKPRLPTRSPTLAAPPTTAPAPAAPGPVASTPPPTVSYVPTVEWTVAKLSGSGVDVYSDPSAAVPTLHLGAQTEFGNQRVLPAIGQQGGWLEVRLPVRPNNIVGWIKASDVTLSSVPDRITVNLSTRQLQWYQGLTLELSTPAGIGGAGSPTPPGEYYITDVLSSSGAYGPWILALNGHSDTFTDFEGGDARLAIHGTNDPSSVGAAASHGCVHVSNDVDARLAASLRPGTLVEIATD